MVMHRRRTMGTTGLPLLYDWDLKTSLVDSVQGQTCQLYNMSRTSNGLAFTGQYQKSYFGEVFPVNRTLEVTVDYMQKSSSMTSSANGRFIMLSDASSMSMSTGTTNGFIWRGSGSKWGVYRNKSWTMSNNNDPNVFNGKKLIMKYYLINDRYYTDIYADDTLIFSYDTFAGWNNAGHPFLEIGTYGSAYYNATVSRVRIFEGV